MQYKWIQKNISQDLIIFFNGWGMNEEVVQHLDKDNQKTKDFDCLHFYNYQNIQLPNFDFSTYQQIYLIAWSMGVYISQILPLPYTKKIAFCGTGNPIDDEEGIPVKIYQLTINNFNEQTQKVFNKKIGFSLNTQQTNTELKNELIAIQNYTLTKNSFFDIAFLADKDTIFPFNNQKNYWKNYANKSIILQSKHYPFHLFKTWKEIITL